MTVYEWVDDTCRLSISDEFRKLLISLSRVIPAIPDPICSLSGRGFLTVAWGHPLTGYFDIEFLGDGLIEWFSYERIDRSSAEGASTIESLASDKFAIQKLTKAIIASRDTHP